MSASVYICIKQFNARLGDELSLKVGDKIEVLADDSEYNDGWYMGKNLLTNDVGLYPKSFTQMLKQPEIPLLRSRSRRFNRNDLKDDKNENTDDHSPNTDNNNNNSNNINNNNNNNNINTIGSNSIIGIQNDNHIHNLKISLVQDNQADIHKQQSQTQSQDSNKHKWVKPVTRNDFLNFENKYSDAKSGSGTLKDINNLSKDLHNVSLRKLSSGLDDNTINDIDDVIQQLQVNDKTKENNSSHINKNINKNSNNISNINDNNINNINNANTNNNSNNSNNTQNYEKSWKSPRENPLVTNKSKSLPSTPTLDPSKVAFWSPQQVSSYFQSLNFEPSVANKFLIHQITGDILFELDLTHLKELEIDKFGTRFQIYKEIENLRNRQSEKLRTVSPNSTNSTTYYSNSSSAINVSNNNEFANNSNEAFRNSSDSMKQKQLGLMPSPVYQKGHERKRSKSFDGLDSSMNRDYQFGDNTIATTELYKTKTEGVTSRPTSSIYEASMNSHSRQQSGSKTPTRLGYHTRQSSSNTHRRHSSIFSFFSNNEDSIKTTNKNLDSTPKIFSPNITTPTNDTTISPTKSNRQSGYFSPQKLKKSFLLDSPIVTNIDIVDQDNFSPKKSKSVSHKNKDGDDSKQINDEKRSTSDSTTTRSRLKTLRTTSTQNFKNLTTSKKSKTSAFQEGIQEVSPDEAIKSANYSGWMSKRSGNTLSWRSRYFTLHGTRLSYFTSLKDKREKGLIDITAHKVIPVHTEQEVSGNNDKYVALYASSTGFGRYCFKLVPPAPGFKKGLTFTQPKVHYFAVDSQDDMRGWMKALMTATIDIDDTVPVVSSCSTPTITLAKAQELLAKAREETRLKDEELRSKGYIRDGFEANSTFATQPGDYGNFMTENDISNSIGSNSSPALDSQDDTTVSSHTLQNNGSKPTLSIDSNLQKSNVFGNSPSTPSLNTNTHGSGFTSPYLLASGLFSPKSGGIPSPSEPPTARDYFADTNTSITTTSTSTSGNSPVIASNSTGRVISGKKSSKNDKVLSYTSDSSGNLTFQIKKK